MREIFFIIIGMNVCVIMLYIINPIIRNEIKNYFKKIDSKQ